MRHSSLSHPIRRIREALKDTSEASGLREFKSSAGFAALIQRSASSIRSVECGHTKKWDRLAKHIESMTGVSAAWMLGNPQLSDPIVDVEGDPWDPEKHLDYLGGAGWDLNWRPLITATPRSVVRIATRMVEKKLTEDLLDDEGPKAEPSTAFLADLTALLQRHNFVPDKPLFDLVTESLIADSQQIVRDMVQMVTSSRSTG